MTEKLAKLVRLDQELEAVLSQLSALALDEEGGGRAAKLWDRARFRSMVAFDEHVRMLREVELKGRLRAESTVEELQNLAAHAPKSERKSTFTKVLADDEAQNLAATQAALKPLSNDRNTTEGTGD